MNRIIALFGTLMLFSCQSYKQPKDISYQVLIASDYNGKEHSSYEIIDNPEDLKKLYSTVKEDFFPDVNFAYYRVIALFMGEKNSGGYAVGVDKVREESDKVIVNVYKKYPEGLVTTAITRPYAIIQIKTTKRIEFTEF